MLGILLILKLMLFLASPSGGWMVRVMTPNVNQGQSSVDANWVKTYATSWNKNASGILQTPWTEKYDFPLDWALFQHNCSACFDALALTVEVDGALLLAEGKKFALITKGIEEGALTAVNEDGESLNLLPAKSFEDAARQKHQLQKGGKWKISGKLKYASVDWSLVPVIVNPDGKISSDLDREILWQNKEDLAGSLHYIGPLKSLSLILDGGIILFLLAWATWITSLLMEKGILNWPFVIFGFMLTCLPIATASLLGESFKILRLSNPGNVNHLGILSVVAGTSFLTWAWRKKDFRNFHADRIVQSVFLFFGPAILFFFSKKWWHYLGHWKNWGAGDDWTSYQMFARKIVVEGEWLNAGEGVFIMMPLYRYFVGVYHWLFGQSAFVQNMADVWCILGTTIILVTFAIKFRVLPFLIFISSTIYLSINLLSAFRYHIGKGLVENHALIFMMLAAWFLYRAREGGGLQIFLATLFGIFGYWIRQDHLGAIAGLAFLALEPVAGPTGGWKGYWDRFQLHWNKFAIYWGFGISSVLLICYRNWWLGGAFYPTNINNPVLNNEFYSFPILKGVYTILSGTNWPTPPSATAIILTSGTVLALTALVWRPNVLKDFPLSIGIIIIGLFAPYIFIWNSGYPPRFSIHLLPLALLSVIVVIDFFVKKASNN